jgi:hypothetical protein
LIISPRLLFCEKNCDLNLHYIYCKIYSSILADEKIQLNQWLHSYNRVKENKQQI